MSMHSDRFHPISAWIYELPNCSAVCITVKSCEWKAKMVSMQCIQSVAMLLMGVVQLASGEEEMLINLRKREQSLEKYRTARNGVMAKYAENLPMISRWNWITRLWTGGHEKKHSHVLLKLVHLGQ